MIHVVMQLLMTDNAVTTLVPTTNISAVKGEQTIERPHIIVNLLSTDLDRTKDGMVFETYNIEVYITHPSIYQTWRIHEACRARLDNYKNPSASVSGLGPYDIKLISLVDVMTDAHELDDFYIIRTIYALEMDKWDG
jgi:hypothetical protein